MDYSIEEYLKKFAEHPTNETQKQLAEKITIRNYLKEITSD